MEKRALLVFPCNGNGIEALDCLGGMYELAGFVDDAVEKQGCIVHGYPVYGRAALEQYPLAKVLAVPGSPSSYRSRRQIVEALGIAPDRYATVIHPAASVSKFARIGRNVLVMAGVVITSNATIGDHVCILPNTVIHHDAVVGAWSLIGSNVTLAGGSEVGHNCYIGSGSTIVHNVQVAERTLVGAGSNVIRGTRAETKVAGNPARELSI